MRSGFIKMVQRPCLLFGRPKAPQPHTFEAPTRWLWLDDLCRHFLVWKDVFSIRRGDMNAQAYTDLLDQHYHPFVEEFHPRGVILQQDGPLARSGWHTKDYFLSEAMDVMHWSALSPDMNISRMLGTFLLVLSMKVLANLTLGRTSKNVWLMNGKNWIYLLYEI